MVGGRLLAVAVCLVLAGCAPEQSDGDALSRRAVTTTVAPAALPTSTSSPAVVTTTGSTTSTLPSSSAVALEPDGLGVVAFGDEASDVLATLSALLGPTTDDGPLPACPSGELDRQVQFAELSVLVATFDGMERFVAWDLGPPSGALPRLATAEGITVGSTLAQLRAAYGNRLQLLGDDPFGPAFEIDVPAQGRLGGTLTGTAGDDTVATLSGGDASCA